MEQPALARRPAGVGTHFITYSFTDGKWLLCNPNTDGNGANLLPVVTCPANMIACLSNGSFLLTGGQPDGGIYSGTGVTSNVFDPTVPA